VLTRRRAPSTALLNIGDEVNEAEGAGDNTKLDQLKKQADGMKEALGPEFLQLNAGLSQVNFQSKEGQEMAAELQKLDDLCQSN
jgi:hypothetical protein